MIKKKILTYVPIAVLLLVLSYLTLHFSTNRNPLGITGSGGTRNAAKCSDKQPLKAIKTSDPHLKILTDYQKACDSFVTDKMMLFTSFPENKTTAEHHANEIAKKLKAFKQSGVTPIVIIEPYVGADTMSYASYLAGSYDAGIEYFFKRLKELGVRNDMMGTWVPFPESNIPSWNNQGTAPKDFALCVNKYLSKMKQHFPDVKGSVLLNSETYAPTDVDWQNGEYTDFSEYVGALDKNLVTSFGIQGFPWTTHAQGAEQAVVKASEFLQPDLAVKAAEQLDTRDIWINTGTFGSKYTDEPAKTVRHTADERKVILEGIVQVAKNIQEREGNKYRVSINLFSEDKSDTTEATDWSYLYEPDSTAVLKNFLAQAYEYDLPVSLFDEAK